MRTAAERTVLHLLRLYAGESVAEDLMARIKGSERNLLSEYVSCAPFNPQPYITNDEPYNAPLSGKCLCSASRVLNPTPQTGG